MGRVSFLVVFAVALTACAPSYKIDRSADTTTTPAADTTAPASLPATPSSTIELAAPPTTQPRVAPPTSAPAAQSRNPQAALSFTGTGDSVVQLTGLADRLVILRLTHDGARNFTIWAYDAQGKQDDLLVNVIGAYSGTVSFNMVDIEKLAPTMIEVKADGGWTLDVADIAEASPWDGQSPVNGMGDSVMWIPATARATGPVPIAWQHNGESNFVVEVASATEGVDLLVNEIGAYVGTVVLPKRPAIVVVHADGGWAANPA